MIELRMAFEWTCDDCGRNQFESAITADLGPEDAQEMRDEHGIQPWEQGEFVAAPESVTCRACGATFQAQPYGVED